MGWCGVRRDRHVGHEASLGVRWAQPPKRRHGCMITHKRNLATYVQWGHRCSTSEWVALWLNNEPWLAAAKGHLSHGNFTDLSWVSLWLAMVDLCMALKEHVPQKYRWEAMASPVLGARLCDCIAASIWEFE